MNSTDDTYLQTWIHDRDANAFEALTSKYSGLVYATCLRITRNRTEAEDATQDCFAKLATVASVPRAPLGPWLHRVATNGSLNRMKALGRRLSYESKFANEQVDGFEIDWKDIDRLVDEAMSELPDKLRVPMVAHFLEGESYTSIAKTIGTTRQTITNRVDKGIAVLRKALRKQGVPVSVPALAAMMGSQLAEASVVPMATTATLGKMAMAGAIHSTHAAGTTAATGVVSSGATLLGGIVMTKSTIVGAGVAIAVIIAGATYTINKRGVVGNDTSPDIIATETARIDELQANAVASARELETAELKIASLTNGMTQKDQRIATLEAELAANAAVVENTIPEESEEEKEGPTIAEIQSSMRQGHRYRALLAFLKLSPEVQGEVRAILVDELVRQAGEGVPFEMLRKGAMDTTTLTDALSEHLTEEQMEMWADYEANPEYYQMTHNITRELLDEIPELSNDNRFLAASVISDEWLAAGDDVQSKDPMTRLSAQRAMLQAAWERLDGVFEDDEQNAFFQVWIETQLGIRR